MFRGLVISAIFLVATPAFAKNAWFSGEVSNLITYGPDGSFMVYIENESISSMCKYRRINFRVADMGEKRTELAFSMALAALASGKAFSVVVDIANAGEICNASSTASQGAGIKR